MEHPRLSILVCHLVSRPDKLKRLTDELDRQRTIFQPDMLEVIVKGDHGELTVGEKRNALIEEARGDYLAFVDDDDMVSDTYIHDVFGAIGTQPGTGPDCASLVGRCCLETEPNRLELREKFVHSIECAGWYTGADGVYYRTPNHLNAVRAEYAKRTMFRKVRFSEDQDYSQRLRPLLNTEALIDKPLYFYIQRPEMYL